MMVRLTFTLLAALAVLAAVTSAAPVDNDVVVAAATDAEAPVDAGVAVDDADADANATIADADVPVDAGVSLDADADSDADADADADATAAPTTSDTEVADADADAEATASDADPTAADADATDAVPTASDADADATTSGADADADPTASDADADTEEPADAFDFQQTVIFLGKRDTQPGKIVSIRGGAPGQGKCHNYDPENDPCAIPIQHMELTINSDVPTRDEQIEGDLYLNWGAAEPDQPKDVVGTPSQWTTSSSTSEYYSDLNTFGEGYWMVQVEMDCSKLGPDGLFELKGFYDHMWESDVSQAKCTGSGAVEHPDSSNHVGRCGYINVFDWNQASCHIEAFP